MTTYQAAVGWNQQANLADLADLLLDLHEPRTAVTKPARIQTTLDRQRVASGEYESSLAYDDYLTPAQLRALLVKLGLRSESTGVEVESANITIQLPGQDFGWQVWNATVYHPHPTYGRGRFAAMTFELVLVERLA